MTNVKIEAGTLTASAQDRIVSGLLLPYGEVGRTNLGRFSVDRGAFTLPDDVQVLNANLSHDHKSPIARFMTATDTDAGIVASFKVAQGSEGDELLAKASDPERRPALSIEVADVVLRAGKAVSGRIFGAAFVKQGAFPSATLLAADAGEWSEDHERDETTTYTNEAGTTTTVEAHTETNLKVHDDTTEQEDEEDDMGDSTATAQAGTLAARRAGRGPAGTKPKGISKGELFAMLAGGQRNRGELLAALSDIVPGDTLGIEQPQYVGELWDGKAYERRIIPLFNHADLTSFTVKGWRWVTKPRVAPYAGNKTDVPSNEVETEPVSIDAARIAGAHDIDRKFRDFNDVAFFEAYFAAMTESYALVSDNEVLTEVIAAATPVERGTVPADVPAGLVSVVDGALAILNETDTAPTFAVVATDLWRDILLTPKDKTLEYLSSGLGLESGTLDGFRLIPSSSIGAGNVLTGVKSAVTVHELGGPAPIRVEALDIAKGGIDEGVFGYYAVNVHDDGGLALVTAPAGE